MRRTLETNEVTNGISIGTAVAETATKNNQTLKSVSYKTTNECLHGMVKVATEEDINDEPEVT